MPPQTMYCQAAPCQTPVRSHTTSRFSARRGLLTREPPSGKYT